MAIFHHRKLFQYSTSTKAHSSSSSPCYEFCDPSCSNFDECYYFSGDTQPSITPLPAAPPPPSATVVFQLSPIVIVIVIVLASVFLLVSCSAFILKCFTSLTRFRTRRNNPDPPHSDPPAPGQHESDNLFVDDQDQTVDHPIWLISTVGLQQSVINSITVVKYKKEDGLIEGIDCSVCLGEFEEGETLRLLPKCNHAFHIDCIDPWLRSHTNCPLCRAGIVVNPDPNGPGLGHSRAAEVTQMNDSESSDVELGGIQIGDSSENRGNVDHNEDEIVNNHSANGMDGPLVLERRSFSVQFYRGSNSNPFRLTGSSSSSRAGPRVGPSPGSRFSPMTGPIKRSYSWSERVIGSTDNPRCNSRFSP